MHLREWKLLYLDSNFTEICSRRFNLNYSSIGSGDGLVPIGQHAIILPNYGLYYWSLYATPGLDTVKDFVPLWKYIVAPL